MPSPPPEYADVEELLVDLIGTALDVRVVTDLPAELTAAVLPVIQVYAYGGTDIDPSREIVNIDVDCYVGPDVDGEPDRAGARDLAERARAYLLRVLPGTTVDGVTVQHVRTISRPTAREYDESPIRRRHAAYGLRVATRS